MADSLTEIIEKETDSSSEEKISLSFSEEKNVEDPNEPNTPDDDYSFFNTCKPSMDRLQTLLNSWKNERVKNLRSSKEFFGKDKFSFPKMNSIPQRVKSNLFYFQTNYLLVFLISSIYSALTNPIFLISMLAIGVLWIYTLKLKDEPFTFQNKEVPQIIVYGILTFVTVFTFYYSSAGSIIFWLIMGTIFFVLIHALFYTPDEIDEFGFGLPETTQ